MRNECVQKVFYESDGDKESNCTAVPSLAADNLLVYPKEYASYQT